MENEAIPVSGPKLSGWRFSVAPMMDWTDRHCRAFHRMLTRRARLYSEMVTADAVIHGPRARLLGFEAAEHPVALQLGGAEPAKLAEAARIGADFGYDEINLNCGCPSDRVQSGRFGACLMREPELVAECVAAMRAAVAIPVTVKCRIGVDEQEPRAALFGLVERVAAAGAAGVIVHARKAWLEGLSPKDNRTIPPLDYPLVYELKRAWPDLPIAINGGLADLDAAEAALARSTASCSAAPPTKIRSCCSTSIRAYLARRPPMRTPSRRLPPSSPMSRASCRRACGCTTSRATCSDCLRDGRAQGSIAAASPPRRCGPARGWRLCARR